MSIADNTILDLASAFTPDGLKELRSPECQSDAGFDPISWDDYFAFLDEMKPSLKELRYVQIYNRIFELP